MGADFRIQIPLLETGVPNLDAVLGGGLPELSFTILAGGPGTGKTILAQQMLFHLGTAERPAIYFSILGEPTVKLLRYQQQFTFFEPARVGSDVIYVDLADEVRRGGLQRAQEAISAEVQRRSPILVVIDSYRAIQELTQGGARALVHDLALLLASWDATSLLIGKYDERAIQTEPEFTICDGIIWLSTEPRNDQLVRFLRVLKMRGVDHLTGAYNFTIRSSGLELYTMVEDTIKPEAVRGAQISSGLPELDDLLRGGIPSGTPMLATGAAGTGKSTLAIQYLYRGAVDSGDPGVYFSYEETPEQIVANAARFGWDLRPLVEAGKLRLEYAPLPRVNAHEQALCMRTIVQQMGARRAVVDSLTMLLHRIERPDIIRQLIYQLTTVFRNAGCTALFISDPPVGTPALSRYGVEESIIDGVIILRVLARERTRERTLEIYKLRGVDHATGEHTIKITSGGIRLFPRVVEAAR